MPINAEIPLSGRPQPSAVQQLQQVMGLQQSMQEQRAGAMALDEKQRQQQAQQALDEIAQQTLNADGSANVPAIKDALIRRGFYHLVPAIEKNLYEAQEARAKLDKTIAETGETGLKSQQIKLDILGAHAASVQAMEYDPAAFVSTLGMLQGQGVIPKDEAVNAMVMGIERPELIKQWVDQTLAASKQQRELATSASTAASSATRAATAEAEAAARIPGLQADTAMKQRVLGGMNEQGLTADQQADNTRQAEAAAAQGKRDADLAAYRAARLKPGPSGGRGGAGLYADLPDGDRRLVDAVMRSPTLYDGLTPTVRGRLGAALEEKGFTFGKPLSEAAIGKMAESKSAIRALNDLRVILQKNEAYIGPVAGLAALNPWSTAQQAQSDIDRVRQRVGKAMEGGVLRKEDEEKYKKILATLRDTPETAIYKVDQLIYNVEQDLKTFEDEQRSAGRRMPEKAAEAGKNPFRK